MWNAIDPNLAVDENNVPWLAFGSFWNGIKLVKLNNNLTELANPEEWYTIASRKRDFETPDSMAGNAAIEAPFIYKKDKYYYLFVSFDYCCRAEKSTYKIVVGRSEKIYGPYLDKQGVSMNAGGGSLVQEGDSKWYGVGHNAAYKFDSKEYLIFHGYDAADKGRSKLIIEDLNWDKDGWPLATGNRQ
jgi:arabinan endo-1,5-alpha-L-arabinosidase